jgi:hypothetical protein
MGIGLDWANWSWRGLRMQSRCLWQRKRDVTHCSTYAIANSGSSSADPNSNSAPQSWLRHDDSDYVRTGLWSGAHSGATGNGLELRGPGSTGTAVHPGNPCQRRRETTSCRGSPYLRHRHTLQRLSELPGVPRRYRGQYCQTVYRTSGSSRLAGHS